MHQGPSGPFFSSGPAARRGSEALTRQYRFFKHEISAAVFLKAAHREPDTLKHEGPELPLGRPRPWEW